MPSNGRHKILMEDNAKDNIENQTRLNPIRKEFVKKETIKWLDVGIIYDVYEFDRRKVRKNHHIDVEVQE